MLRLLATPRVRMADVVEGVTTRVAGSVRATGEVLTSPLSGRPCVYYEVAVISVGLSTQNFQRVESRLGTVREGVNFALVEHDAVALVDCEHLDVAVAVGQTTTCKGTFDASPAQLELIRRCIPPGHRWFDTQELVFREACILPDQVVGLVGAAVREPDPDHPPDGLFRGEAATRVRFRGSRAHPLVISDDIRLR